MVTDLYLISEEIRKCVSCRLWKTRMLALAGEGSQTSETMLIAGIPKSEDDRVGTTLDKNTLAGAKLDKLLNRLKLSREDIFITNLVKCFPGVEKITTKELDTCKGKWLMKQIELINPKLIVLCGKLVFDEMIGVGKYSSSIGKEVVVDKQKYLIVKDLY